jgi:hypothetical protein
MTQSFLGCAGQADLLIETERKRPPQSFRRSLAAQFLFFTKIIAVAHDHVIHAKAEGLDHLTLAAGNLLGGR